MLRVNQFSGFGGSASPGMLIYTSTTGATNSPSFTINLGPPGVKQVICAFATTDNVEGNDSWQWGTGSVGGEAFTYAVGSGQESAGDGASYTSGTTIRALQTNLIGEQTVSIPINLFLGTMNSTGMLAFVVRGFSATPIAYDGGNSQGGSAGDNFTINTAGARLVIGAATGSSPGNMQGPGSEVTTLSNSVMSLGYDLSPAGGGSDVYSFTGGKYGISGASFG